METNPRFNFVATGVITTLYDNGFTKKKCNQYIKYVNAKQQDNLKFSSERITNLDLGKICRAGR